MRKRKIYKTLLIYGRLTFFNYLNKSYFFSSIHLDSVTGELMISNHSVSHSGVYSCEVSNAVGKESCRLNLQAVKRKWSI